MTALRSLSSLVVSACVALASLGVGSHARDGLPTLGRETDSISFGSYVRKVIWSPDQRHIAILTDNGKLTLRDVQRRSERWSIERTASGWLGNVAFVSSGRFLLTSATAVSTDAPAGGTRLYLRDASSGRPVRPLELADITLPGPNPLAHGFVVPQDGRHLAAQFSASALIYDTNSWTPIKLVGPMIGPTDKPAGMVKGIALDTTRDRLVFAGYGGTLLPSKVTYARMQTWRVSDNTRLADFTTYKTGLQALIVEPATGNIITGGDGTIVPFEAPPLQPTGKVHGIEDEPETKVRAYDPISGALVRTYLGPGGGVGSLNLSPNGRYLAASKARRLDERADAYVIAWETATGRMIAATSYGQELINAVSFSPDGKRLAISVGSTVRIIDLDPKLFP